MSGMVSFADFRTFMLSKSRIDSFITKMWFILCRESGSATPGCDELSIEAIEETLARKEDDKRPKQLGPTSRGLIKAFLELEKKKG